MSGVRYFNDQDIKQFNTFSEAQYQRLIKEMLLTLNEASKPHPAIEQLLNQMTNEVNHTSNTIVLRAVAVKLIEAVADYFKYTSDEHPKLNAVCKMEIHRRLVEANKAFTLTQALSNKKT